MLLVMGVEKGAKLKATVEVAFEAIEDRLTAVPDPNPAGSTPPESSRATKNSRVMGGQT